MKTKKKNRFFTFCMSCIPGAGEMYMGFMKTGVSLMILFALTIIFAVSLHQGTIAVFCVVEWFYSFFHANHLASLDDEEFAQVEDKYLLKLDEVIGVKDFIEKYNKWVAYGLILIGISFLWITTAELLYNVLPNPFMSLAKLMWRVGDYMPSILVGIGVIFIGIRMIMGKKERTDKIGIPEKEIIDMPSDSGKQEE